MRRHGNIQPLRFEGLESRAMLAGNVQVFGGLIDGDGAANHIVIQQVGKAHSDGSITIRVTGIGTKLQVAKYAPNDGPLIGFNTTYSALVTAFGLQLTLGGGNDSLTISNTSFGYNVSIDMGSGNDTVVMNNVRELFPGFMAAPGMGVADDGGHFAIDMGSGNDTVLLNNVRVATNFFLSAGDGRDSVTLNRVASGLNKTVYPTSQFNVDMGPGNLDALTEISCTGDQAIIYDTGGSNGSLIRFGNHFSSESDYGFSSMI
jgi:hypothetical protein